MKLNILLSFNKLGNQGKKTTENMQLAFVKLISSRYHIFNESKGWSERVAGWILQKARKRVM